MIYTQNCDVSTYTKAIEESQGAERLNNINRLYSFLGKNQECNQAVKEELREILLRLYRNAGNKTFEAKILLIDAINIGHSPEKVQEKLGLLHQAKAMVSESCTDSACRDVQMDIIINLGYTSNVSLRYDSVVYYSLRAEELIPNAPRVELKVKAYLLGIGAYMIQNQMDKSLRCAQNAYEFAKTLTSSNKLNLTVTALENLSYQHYINHNLDSALHYASVALSDPVFVENVKFKQNMFARRGYVYYDKGDYAKYLEACDSALECARAIGDETLLAVSYQQYANALDRNKRYPEALKAADESFTYSLKTAMTDIAVEALRVKMAVLEQTGNYKEALNTVKFFYHLRDSLSQVKNEAAAEKMRLEFEAEKKDLDILQLNSEKLLAEKKRQNQFIIFLAAVLLLLLVAGFFWMRQRRKTLEKQLLEKELNAEHNRIGQMLAEQENKITTAELEALNRERNKISEVLSKNVLGALKPLKDDVNQLKIASLDAVSQKLVKELENKIHSLHLKVEQLSSELTPVETEPESNYCDDLQIFINNFFRGKNHKVKIRIPEPEAVNQIDNEKKVLVYRILQEALANVIKHSNASIVNIDVYTNADWLNLGVEDNGKGFSFEQQNWGKGLVNLKSVIANQGGIFTVKSNLGSGTKISAVLPLPKT